MNIQQLSELVRKQERWIEQCSANGVSYKGENGRDVEEADMQELYRLRVRLDEAMNGLGPAQNKATNRMHSHAAMLEATVLDVGCELAALAKKLTSIATDMRSGATHIGMIEDLRAALRKFDENTEADIVTIHRLHGSLETMEALGRQK